MTELWVQKDGYGNGRVLYVSEPGPEGYIDVGIAGVYEKTLTSVEARKMAKALKKAAKVGRDRGGEAQAHAGDRAHHIGGHVRDGG